MSRPRGWLTERRRLRAKLEQCERELAEVERVARVGTWTLDVVTGEVASSTGVCSVFGLDPDRDGSGPGAFLSRIDRDHRRVLVAAVDRCRESGAPFSLECPITVGDGELRRVVVEGHRFAEGAEVRVRGTVRDVSSAGTDGLSASGHFEDALTRLPNRAWLQERASTMLLRAERNGWSTAVLAIGIDKMHDVNVSFGLSGGDRVLVEIARRLRETFRPYDAVVRHTEAADTVGRGGGDVFVVVCEGIDDTSAVGALCQRAIAALRAEIEVPQGSVSVTAAVGAVVVPPGVVDFGGQLVAAETAMREAKSAGGDRYEVFTSDMQHGGREAATATLQQALDDGELRLFYQPKVALDGSGIAGVEALLRWQHPEDGLVPPAKFVSLAERTGLIIPIGNWALEEACRQAASWRESMGHSRPFMVSVNVSSLQLEPELVDTVKSALAAADLPPTCLCLELTESVLMEDVGDAISTLREIADMGVSVSVDDFGTGYSSLAYLKRLPLHELKIDRSFVEGLGTDPDSTAIVAAVVAMAHALDLRVVAEGVETASQLEELRTLGCDEAQGYHLGRPRPPDTITALLRGGHTAASDAGRPADERAASGAGLVEGPERVLVVDDADDVRQLAQMSLIATGFDVHVAASGAEAIEAARRLRPRCILLDIELPGASGFDVCRILRADPVMADCTIVMLTSRHDAGDKVEAFSIGADDYIVKPFSPRDLTSRVRAAMARRHGTEPDGSSGPEDGP